MANITKVYLLKVPLENDYKHTIYFANATAQQTYFSGKVVKSFTDFTYLRKDNVVKVPVQYDEIYSCNYLMYQNSDYSNKWFYCFITDMKYINDGMTELTIETDVMQTWYFDHETKPSFVEREHVDDDTIGLHTLPEGLETGEFICMGTKYDEALTTTSLVLGTTVSADGENVQGGYYNGIYSGLKYYTGNATSINNLIKLLTEGSKELGIEGGKADAINCIFIAPLFLGPNSETESPIPNSNTVKSFESIYAKPQHVAGHIPKNNKLLTFPYSYLLVSNNNGGSAIYKYEYFNGTYCDFIIEGAITPGCSIRLTPKNYKQLSYNNEEGLNLGKYPICNWNTDVYTNWLTQNSVNVALDLVSGGLQVIGGVAGAVATGGIGGVVGMGTAVSGVQQITSTLAQVHTQSFTPPQSKGNTNCGDVITAGKKNTFVYYQMCIKPEYAQIIDEYFTMFGYKVNRVKKPNYNHRSRFWYTKTIDVDIEPINNGVPIKDIQKIKDVYNNGVTFWRNANDIGNYTSENTTL